MLKVQGELHYFVSAQRYQEPLELSRAASEGSEHGSDGPTTSV